MQRKSNFDSHTLYGYGAALGLRWSMDSESARIGRLCPSS